MFTNPSRYCVRIPKRHLCNFLKLTNAVSIDIVQSVWTIELDKPNMDQTPNVLELVENHANARIRRITMQMYSQQTPNCYENYFSCFILFANLFPFLPHYLHKLILRYFHILTLYGPKHDYDSPNSSRKDKSENYAYEMYLNFFIRNSFNKWLLCGK